MTRDTATVFFAALLTLMLVSMDSDRELQEEDDLYYCEMRKIYEETNGEYGWPPYRENFNCQDMELELQQRRE